MKVFKKLVNFYKVQIDKLIEYCKNLDNHKTAFAIAAALCIGVTPLFGFTFLLVTIWGLVFRLNQVILQSVHLLVAPLQVLLFYPFMQAGKLAFDLNKGLPVSMKEMPNYIRSHTSAFIQEYLGIFLAGTAVWAIMSLFVGYFIYRVIYFYLEKGAGIAEDVKF